MLIHRVPVGLGIGGRSHCSNCKSVLGPLELVPVFSYLFLGGKCKTCKNPIGFQSQITEVASAAVFVLAATLHTELVTALFLALALWLLLIISIIDLRTRTISDGLNIPFVVTGACYSYLVGTFSLSGMALAGVFFGGLWLASKGRWIGSGDVILGFGIGAMLGSWSMTLASLMLTYIIGAIIILILLITRVITRQHYVAFAPFLAIGVFMTIAFRECVDTVLLLYFGI